VAKGTLCAQDHGFNLHGATRVAANDKKLKLLRGYADWDRSDRYAAGKDWDNALAAINRACSYGDHWRFLVQRAEVHYLRDDLQAALDDLNTAERLRPGEPDILLDRVRVHRALKHWENAGRDLLSAVRTNATSSRARQALPTVVKGLIFEGWQHHKAGRRDDALRVLDLAAELDPQNLDLNRRRAFIVEGRTAGPDSSARNVAPDIEVLREAVKQHPNNLRAHQQLDYNLAR
jgi:tetratricopeptide (TPR) repeat protein